MSKEKEIPKYFVCLSKDPQGLVWFSNQKDAIQFTHWICNKELGRLSSIFDTVYFYSTTWGSHIALTNKMLNGKIKTYGTAKCAIKDYELGLIKLI